jgi:hypothetical protein
MPHSATNPQNLNIVANHELKEITEILVRHHGIREGLYDLLLEFQIGIGAAGPDPSSVVPSAMVGVRRIGLTKTTTPGASTVDAAAISPPVEAKKSSAKKPAAKPAVKSK